MAGILMRGVRRIKRELEFIEETGLRPTELRRARQMRQRGIHWTRYQLLRKRWLLDAGVRTVLDIGANIGEYSGIFAELFPDAHIYAFEPLPECFERLQIVAETYGRVTAFKTGLGSEEGSLEFHRSSWLPASSFREMTDLHRTNFPHSADSESIEIPVTTLDKVLTARDLEDNILIKMDVQGYEDEVIKGGLDIIAKAKILIVECSLQTTYENEPMFHGIYGLLTGLGYQYRGSIKQTMRTDDQSFLQADCVFVRPNWD
jgi:FkbM family methyltransferase